MEFDYSFYQEFNSGYTPRQRSKPKSLEDPIEDNYTQEQIQRLVSNYNDYLDSVTQLAIDVKTSKKPSKSTGNFIYTYNLYNLNCTLSSKSILKNTWTIKDNSSVTVFKGTFEDCLRYLVKYCYVVPREDVSQFILAKQ